ncbi:hypothetical protein HU200_003849 [Digitaria exilis]|uniref:Uncharacterized protein n=1 Tax=Digitaria exilis TaxID=1010633 RepID=A0A835FW60_9POAL|nr:hypothetical protein HU200_003849 [Digitaria exilis]
MTKRLQKSVAVLALVLCAAATVAESNTFTFPVYSAARAFHHRRSVSGGKVTAAQPTTVPSTSPAPRAQPPSGAIVVAPVSSPASSPSPVMPVTPAPAPMVPVLSPVTTPAPAPSMSAPVPADPAPPTPGTCATTVTMLHLFFLPCTAEIQFG